METNGDELSLREILETALVGMKATAQEAMKPPVTEFYPEQRPRLPWSTKAQLYVDVNDCISCYKCAKACPSDCIRIDSVRAPAGLLADTTDGHKRTFEVVRFDIDMGQCCYCGLCTGRSSYTSEPQRNDRGSLGYADKTAACPTDCINFYPRFENGTEDADNLMYHFAVFDFDEAKAQWNAASPNARRSTHPGKPEADYENKPPQTKPNPEEATHA